MALCNNIQHTHSHRHTQTYRFTCKQLHTTAHPHTHYLMDWKRVRLGLWCKNILRGQRSSTEQQSCRGSRNTWPGRTQCVVALCYVLLITSTPCRPGRGVKQLLCLPWSSNAKYLLFHHLKYEDLHLFLTCMNDCNQSINEIAVD